MESYTFENGFRVIYEPPKNTLPISCIHGFVDLGSIYENDGVRGSSHFIEHMCFKGTRKIPTSNKLATKFDEVGAFFNAYTDKQYTCYTVKCQDSFVKNCIYILSDMLLNSTFPKHEYEKEKRVVIEEMIKRNDNPKELITILADKFVYSGTSYAYPIDILEYHRHGALPYEAIIEMYKAFYRPSRFVLSIVSQIPFAKIKHFIRDSFFMRVPSCNTIYDPSRFFVKNILYPQTQIQYKVETKKGVSATYVSIVFRTCNHDSPDRHILTLLSDVIGGPMSSRLFSILREQNGLTYTSYCYNNNYACGGEFGFFTLANPIKILKNGSKLGVIPLIIGLIRDLIKNGITRQELEKTKGYLNGVLTMNLEDASIQCQHNGRNMLIHGNNPIIPYDHKYKRLYEPITLREINRVIRTYFIPDNMSVILLGEKVPSLEKVKKVVEHFDK